MLIVSGYHVTGLHCTHENFKGSSNRNDAQMAADICRHLDIPFQEFKLTAKHEEGLLKYIFQF